MAGPPSQRWDPARYARNARFVSELGAPVVDLLDPQPGERLLDLGCGDGALTRELMARGCRVLGIDSSPEQVAAARRQGLDARVGDAAELAFDGEFDAVFSNAALHWVRRADEAIAGVHAALVPGGRFVGEFGGAGNVSAIREALTVALAERGVDAAPLDPWFFPTDDEYRARLQAGGFQVREVRLFARPTPLPGDVAEWLEIFAQPFLGGVADAQRGALIDRLRELLRPRLCDAGGRWAVDYVRLRFAADKP
ncbi:MAG: class I SAM-dependent methyltransferase [Myxococcota bacterium]